MEKRDLLRAAFGHEAITDPGFGLDVFLLRGALQFFAQLPDKDAEIFRLLRRLRSPDRREQSTMGEHFAGVAREEQQQIEFLGRQVH